MLRRRVWSCFFQRTCTGPRTVSTRASTRPRPSGMNGRISICRSRAGIDDLDPGQGAIEPGVDAAQHDVVMGAVEIPELGERVASTFEAGGPSLGNPASWPRRRRGRRGRRASGPRADILSRGHPRRSARRGDPVPRGCCRAHRLVSRFGQSKHDWKRVAEERALIESVMFGVVVDLPKRGADFDGKSLILATASERPRTLAMRAARVASR